MIQASGAYVCPTCEPGYYCASKTTSRNHMLTVMICPAGLHCPAGTNVAPDLVSHACAQGSYCLRGDQVNIRMNKWMNEWTYEWMNKWMNEQMNEWMNKWMNKWMNQ